MVHVVILFVWLGLLISFDGTRTSPYVQHWVKQQFESSQRKRRVLSSLSHQLCWLFDVPTITEIDFCNLLDIRSLDLLPSQVFILSSSISTILFPSSVCACLGAIVNKHNKTQEYRWWSSLDNSSILLTCATSFYVESVDCHLFVTLNKWFGPFYLSLLEFPLFY